MNIPKIEIIYQMLIKRIKLTNESLRLHGFNKDEINNLLEKRIIEQTSDDSYKLYQVDKLRKYGVTLLQNGKTAEADACFRVCYELVPTGKHICLQAMLAALNRHEYRQLFEIYQNLEKNHPEKNKQNNLLYLYLLSIITKVPEELQERTRKIEPSEIILPHTNSSKIENQIRTAISQNKFSYACQLIKERIKKEQNYSVKFELLDALCNEAADWTRRFKYKIYQLIETESYEQIRTILLEQNRQRKLSELETNILLLTDAIIKIQETGNIPIVTIESTNNMQEAILGNNYALALSINDEFLEFHHIYKKTNSINILLEKINHIILELKSKQTLDLKNKEVLEQLENIYLEIEELANFIQEQNISIDEAIKNIGLFPEQALLVKLVYAKNCYEQFDYDTGDKYLNEVEKSNFQTDMTILLLEQIKTFRSEFSKENTYIRSLSKITNKEI